VAESETFTIGAKAQCTDGDCGEVRRVIVNPVAREVTHLVVEPKGRLGLARLVPLDLVDASGDQVEIHCTLASSPTSNPPRTPSSYRGPRATPPTARSRCSPGPTTAWGARER